MSTSADERALATLGNPDWVDNWTLGGLELHVELMDTASKDVWLAQEPFTRRRFEALEAPEGFVKSGIGRSAHDAAFFRRSRTLAGALAGALAAVSLAAVTLAAAGCAGGEAHAAAPTAAGPTTTTTPEVPTMQQPDGLTADDIPVAHTPPGGYGDTFPEPVLTRCTEPLVAGAPDMRGMWKAVAAERNGEAVPAGDRIYSHHQRIEQCGNRVTITAGGIIHDMRADGTEAGGVHDVAESDHTTPITVVATFSNGVHVLRPEGVPIEVTRHLEGDQLVWNYLGTKVTLDRVGGPNDPPPVT